MYCLRMFIFLCFSFCAVAQTAQPLTNKDVINMTIIGLPANLIIAKVKKTGGKFETSPTALKELKDANVPEEVILYLIENDQPSQKADEKKTEITPTAKDTAKPIKKPSIWGRTKTDQRYDKFKDHTVVRFSPLPINSTMSYVMSSEIVNLQVAFIFKGQQKSQPVDEAVIALKSTSKDWVFLKDSHFIALVDGQRVDLGEAERDSDIRWGVLQETVMWKITRAQLEQLAYGNSVEIQAGRKEYKLRDNHLYALREIVELMK